MTDLPTGTRIEVYGSMQPAFVNQPTIRVLWKGNQVGTVEHGGTFVFDAEGDGEVGFRYLLRSARVRVSGTGVTAIQLSWDRIWGRLIARVVPRR